MSGRQARWAATAVLVGLLGACAGPAAGPAGTPSAEPAQPADGLTITHDDGAQVTTWTLSCDPPAGTHPDPAHACTVLDGVGAAAFATPEPGRTCTQQYGGPDTATVVGRWQGRPVDAGFSLRDGCEIARWAALDGLLPALPG